MLKLRKVIGLMLGNRTIDSMPMPLSNAQVERYGKVGRMAMMVSSASLCVLMASGYAFLWNLNQQVALGHAIPAHLAMWEIVGSIAIVMLATMAILASGVREAMKPLVASQCATMMGLCLQYPGLDSYRSQVLDQGRPFVGLDLDLARRLAFHNACQRLHGLVA